MTIQYTTWSPDTCGCTLVYSWDDKEPGETRQHNIHEIIKACPDHEHLTLVGKQHHYNAVLEENQRKNKAHFKINEGKQEITWRWEGESPNRILYVHDGKEETRHDNQK